MVLQLCQLALAALLPTARSRIGSGVVELTASTFDSYISTNDRVMVDFMSGTADDELMRALRTVRGFGSSVPLVKVNVQSEPELAKRFVPDEQYPQLIWFLHGELTSYHRSLRNADAITSFVLSLDRPPMKEVKSVDIVKDWNIVAFVKAPKGSELHKMAEVVAAKHLDVVAFAHLDDPAMTVTWYVESEVKGIFNGEPSVAAVERFVMERLTTSEDLPEQPVDDDGITYVVGKSFHDIVLSEEKDVFIMVYAAWCGFCKRAMPVWSDFARRVAGEEHLVVAKMDGTTNRLGGNPDFLWEAYPHIMFVKAGASRPLIYNGNRTVEGYVDFASKHAKHTLANTKESKEL